MKSPEGNDTDPEAPADSRDEVTGFPGLRTWRSVYLFVFGCFILSVVLLIALSVIYSS
jgi:hypothetical protein